MEISWTAPTPPSTVPKSPPPGGSPVTVMASRLELRRLRDVPSFLAAAATTDD
jgi:hypothetical protein